MPIKKKDVETLFRETAQAVLDADPDYLDAVENDNYVYFAFIPEDHNEDGRAAIRFFVTSQENIQLFAGHAPYSKTLRYEVHIASGSGKRRDKMIELDKKIVAALEATGRVVSVQGVFDFPIDRNLFIRDKNATQRAAVKPERQSYVRSRVVEIRT